MTGSCPAACRLPCRLIRHAPSAVRPPSTVLHARVLALPLQADLERAQGGALGSQPKAFLPVPPALAPNLDLPVLKLAFELADMTERLPSLRRVLPKRGSNQLCYSSIRLKAHLDGLSRRRLHKADSLQSDSLWVNYRTLPT